MNQQEQQMPGTNQQSNYKYAQLQQRLEILLAGMPPSSPLPTVRTLMREFRVSQITVTRALDELQRRGLVIREPRRRLLSAPEVPPAAATRPISIALVLPVASSHFGRSLIRVLESSLGGTGAVTVFESRNLLDKEAEVIRNLGSMDFSGVIIWPAFDHLKFRFNPALEALLRASIRYPFTIIASPGAGYGCPGLGFSSYDAMLAATDMLLDCGVRRLACLPYFDSIDEIETFNGIRAALNHRNGSADLSIRYLGRTQERKEEEVAALLKEQPDAVIVIYPPYIYFLEKAVAAAGLRVPEDLLVVAVLEDDYRDYTQMPLIAVRRPTAALAERALADLQAKINFTPPPPEERLAAELVTDPRVLEYFASSGGGLLKKFRYPASVQTSGHG